MPPKRKASTISGNDVANAANSQTVAQETPPDDVFIPPSIKRRLLLKGESYTHHSPIPRAIAKEKSQECVLGVDEAGRGPVLGPMVYGICYLPLPQHRALLAETHHFDDSKVLTPEFRSQLLRTMCTPSSDLYQNCGWATRVMSARDISSGMLRPSGSSTYNLNAQAMDATMALIQEVMDRGVNITEIYVDTIGQPAPYQKKLEKVFPTARITVAKKADSLYPCVSAASVAAKVTRDAALEVCWKALHSEQKDGQLRAEHAGPGWGSGYPSDGRCSGWLKGSMHPLFGWGAECRFSWGTAKDLLEAKGKGVKVEWPEVDDEDANMRISHFLNARADGTKSGFVADDDDDLLGDKWKELSTWYGKPVTVDAT